MNTIPILDQVLLRVRSSSSLEKLTAHNENIVVARAWYISFELSFRDSIYADHFNWLSAGIATGGLTVQLVSSCISHHREGILPAIRAAEKLHVWLQ